MCGRFKAGWNAHALAGFELDEAPDPADLGPRYNVAPGQPVAAVLNRRPRRLEQLRWGLVPSWADDPSVGNRMINARAETLAEKPAFREALTRRRCLIPADGFYEWLQQGKRKTPHLIQLTSEELFAFAGLWDAWRAADGTWLRSLTIVTCPPNQVVAPIHDRMPVMLPRAAWEQWLDPAETAPDALRPLLVPFDAALMKATPVGQFVNDANHEGPACLAPPEPEPPPRQLDLFSHRR